MDEKSIAAFVKEHEGETAELLKTLAAIPAPSHREEKRAHFVRNWLTEQGAKNVWIDEAGNVLYLFAGGDGCAAREGRDPKTQTGLKKGAYRETEELTVMTAHMDVVFPDMEPLPVREENGRLFAPGVGDNTANLVNMLMTIKFLLQHPAVSDRSILFAANVCEEGLGNLKGSRAIMEQFRGRIREWISFDLYYDGLCSGAVGSQRYKVRLQTRGGHSYSDFGEENAIAKMAELVTDLYHQKVPGDVKTTYNVGQISGGTSINAIAQEAVMTYEFRSESAECMKKMEASFQRILEEHRGQGVEITTEILGIRPGKGAVDEARQESLVNRCLCAMRQHYDGPIRIRAASTDANIPLSEGIPAVTAGTVLGGLLHTREEWVELASMTTGQKIAIELVMACFAS